MNSLFKHRRQTCALVRSKLGRAAVAAGFAAIATPATGADRSWGNTGGGTFSTTTNWISGLIAGVNDVAIFSRSRGDSQAAYTVSFSGNAQNQSLFVGPDIVTFALGGRTYTTTAINGNEVGTSTAFTSRLTVQNGVFNMTGALPPTMRVGGAAGRVGSLIFTSNATLTGAPNLLVGTPSATGFVTLNGFGGGTATTSLLDVGSGAGGRGSVFVNGPFAMLTTGSLIVGNAGTGTLLTEIGGTLQSNGGAVVGNASGSAGNVTLDGGTTRWIQTGSMTIGNSGAGTVTVTGGGSLSAIGADVTLGNNGGSIGRLLLSGGSSRARTDQLLIGNAGIGIMHVSGGASINSATSNIVSETGNGFVDISDGGAWFSGGTATIANGLNSVGRVDVRGLGSRWTCGTLLIGNRGHGSLNVSDGASVSTGGNATVGFEQNGGGTVTVDGVGSIWSIFSGSLSVGRNGSGHMQITNGGRVQSQSLDSRINGPAGVVVQGQDSTWLTDGLELTGNTATLAVSSGGIVDSSFGQVPSVGFGGVASATFTGAATQWRIETALFVGDNAFGPIGSVGTLSIENGATVDVGQSVRVGENGTIILNGGTLRLAVLTLDSTAAFQFDAGLLRITGNPSFDSPFLDKVLGPTHTLAAGRHISVGGTPTLTASLILDGGILTVPTLGPGSPIQFDGGTLNLTSANLVIGASGLLGGSVVLDDRNLVVTNATTIDPASQLTFAGGHFSSGGGITNFGRMIVNSPVASSFGDPIVNNGEIRVEAGATASFSGNVTGPGSFVGGGGKVFKTGSTSSVGAIDTAGSTTVEAGATLSATRIRESSLVVGGVVNINPNGSDSSTSVLGSLSVIGGKLNLADNTLVIDYTGGSPLSQVGGFIQTGFAHGSWNGVGINSSTAAATANRALGYAEATDIGTPAVFAGQAIDGTSVLVRYTLVGDANLDRAVGIDDFGLLASNFNQPSRWSRGDFNFDGNTTIDDFGLLAGSFNQSLPMTPPRGSSVPEAGVGGALIGALLVRRRRANPAHRD